MILNIYSFVENTKVEGPGLRDCIYVQGCSNKCPGCNSQETWDFNKGEKVDINDLSNKIISNKKIEGITFSGGEPFDQSKALYKLGKQLKENNLSIVTYTGYEYEHIKKENKESWNKLLSITDILISGSFKEELKDFSTAWIGSSNQEIHFLSKRYSYLEDKLDTIKNKVEIRFKKNGEISAIGIADKEKIEKLLENKYYKPK